MQTNQKINHLQIRELRRYELYKAVAEKLKADHELFSIATSTLEKLNNLYPDNNIVKDWVNIFETKQKREIIEILLQNNPEGERLREITPTSMTSSSRVADAIFVEIISDSERHAIFNKYFKLRRGY